jgi:hypothetical protein
MQGYQSVPLREAIQGASVSAASGSGIGPLVVKSLPFVATG